MATRSSSKMYLAGSIRDRNVANRMNPEGFCPDDDNTSDSGAETFTGLHTDAEDAMIHRIDSKYGLGERKKAPKAKRIPYVGPPRTGKRYQIVGSHKILVAVPAPVVAKAPAPVVVAPKPAVAPSGARPTPVVVAKAPAPVPVAPKAPVTKPAPAPRVIALPPKSYYRAPAPRPNRALPGRTPSASHPALALRSRPLSEVKYGSKRPYGRR